MNPPALLTNNNFNIHKSLYRESISKNQKLQAWLVGVLKAMKYGELEDAMRNSWDIHSNPEKRVVHPQDRPADEWDNIAWQRIVRSRSRQVHVDAWGNIRER
jgi:hypothetical protein